MNKLTFLIILLIPSSLIAQPLVYAGRYSGSSAQVILANKIALTVPVWSGYERRFTITLSGIAIPSSAPKRPVCEKKLAAQALNFSKTLIQKADQIVVEDIRMQDSRKKEGFAQIFADDKKLSEQLLSAGLARSQSIPADQPWCEDNE
ncbi:MAG: thermonuclease family protein [bacterium]